jgi:phenylalanyl-tRNA synthetase beta chain
MKVTLNWLNQYATVTGTVAELTERLTQLGLEVEGVQTLAGDFGGVVVAQVLTRDKHPNADKLSVCRVQDGQGERQIVCGARNFQPGDKVPLILPGHALPPKAGETQPFVIKVGKIRGVESHGMMCSADELGLDPEAIGLRREDGLLILRPDARVGQPFAEYLGRSGSDVVFDLEVTPNRPDLNSVIGIARELAAVTHGTLRLPVPPTPPASGERVDALVAVQLDAPDLCPRYTARVVKGVKIGPSPDWLRHTLEKVGLRSVNNVVDVTNFVMLETGQPLHAFDYRLIAPGADGRPTLVIRRAATGEAFVTLDGKEHRLTDAQLLIADPEKGIALAGIMGGRNTEISETTTDVLVESAYFSPTNIRRSSKQLGLRTDASYRFERGADIEACDIASRRCMQLILETAGGTAVEGVVDAYPAPVQAKLIPLRHRKVNELLGVDLPGSEIDRLLGSLGLKAVPPNADTPPTAATTFSIPTYRVDLKRESDLIEEVARMYGVERIPATPPRGALGSHPFDARYDALARLRELLIGLGLTEVQGQTLMSATEAHGCAPERLVRLANPLSSDMDILRPSLIPGLVTILQHNVHRKTPDVAVFELGRVFVLEGGTLRERWRLGMALTGLRSPGFWSGASRDEKCDVFDLKGILEEVIERLGLRGVVWSPRSGPTAQFLESAEVTLGGRLLLGELGQLQPALARRYDLRDAVLLAELDIDQLLQRANPERNFKPLPSYPAIRRDLALLVPESVTHESVLNTVRKSKPSHLEGLELFDVFRGKQVPDGFKSLAYAFTYRAADRTLKDDEVNASQSRIVEALKLDLKAQVRE